MDVCNSLCIAPTITTLLLLLLLLLFPFYQKSVFHRTCSIWISLSIALRKPTCYFLAFLYFEELLFLFFVAGFQFLQQHLQSHFRQRPAGHYRLRGLRFKNTKFCIQPSAYLRFWLSILLLVRIAQTVKNRTNYGVKRNTNNFVVLLNEKWPCGRIFGIGYESERNWIWQKLDMQEISV